MTKALFIFGFLLFTNHILMSQDKKWTLEECINRALEENITVNQKKLSNTSTELTLVQSKAARIPTLSGSTGQSFSFGRSLDPHTNTYEALNIASSNFSLSSNVSLFTGFQTTNTIRKNELDLKAGEFDLEKTKRDITLSVTLAYLNVLFAYEQIENARIQVEATQAQVERTRILVEAKTLPIGNLYSIQSQLATNKYNLVTAENQLSISKVNLMQLMEHPVDPKFDIIRPGLDDLIIEIASESDPDSIYARALRIQPEIASSELKVASAETSLKISKGAMYPRLSLSSGISSAYSDARPRTFDQQLNDNLSESVRLSLSIPIFNQKQVSTSIKKSQINVYSTQLAALDTKNQLRKSIEQAYNDLVAARHNYDAVRDQLVSTETSYNDAKKKFDLGMITATDFLIEMNNYSTAINNFTRAKYNYLFMKKILDFYQGNPIEL